MKSQSLYTTEMLYAAFRFRKTQLWDILQDEQMFAVALPSGEIGYCLVMGSAGTYYGLALYRGNKGLATFYSMMCMPEDQIEANVAIMAYNAINCNFSQANNMNFGIKEPIRSFSKEHKMPIPKKNGWPEFVRYAPFRQIAPVENEIDGKDITTALNAASFLAEELKTHTPEELGLGIFEEDEDNDPVYLPLLVNDGDDKWHIEYTELPQIEDDVAYPKPLFPNLKDISAIRKMPKAGMAECGAISLQQFSTESQNTPFIIPMLKNGYLAIVMSQEAYDTHPEKLLKKMVDELTRSAHVPETIYCTDELTLNLLTDFCKKVGIKLLYSAKSADFQEACYDILRSVMMGGI